MVDQQELRIGAMVRVIPDHVADRPAARDRWQTLLGYLKFEVVRAWIFETALQAVPSEMVCPLSYICLDGTEAWPIGIAIIVQLDEGYWVAIWKRNASRYELIRLRA